MSVPSADVRYLLRRLEFASLPDRVQALTGSADRAALVDTVLDQVHQPVAPPAHTYNTAWPVWRRIRSVRRWWYLRMATSPTPLVERMTLFWHGHFATSFDKVYSAANLLTQTETFRAHALGNFRTLCHAVALDPAMLHFLDNDSNRRGAPQENWAREFWELFSLGVNQYTQDDVVAASRAWTGYSLTGWTEEDLTPRSHVFRSSWHDTGQKTIFGRTGPWTGPEVIDLTFEAKADVVARFLATKLWNHFAFPNGPTSAVDAVAASLLASDWEIRPALRTLLLRDEFWDPANRGLLVRQPAEYITAAVKHSGVRMVSDAWTDDAGYDSTAIHAEWYDTQMGQAIAFPPNVSGWRQNTAWLDPASWWGRGSFARQLSWLARHPANGALFEDLHTVSSPSAVVEIALEQFGLQHAGPQTRQALEQYVTSVPAGDRWSVRDNIIVAVLLTPEFNLA